MKADVLQFILHLEKDTQIVYVMQFFILLCAGCIITMYFFFTMLSVY